MHTILPLVLTIIEILTEHFVNDGNGNFESRQIIEKVKWRGNIDSEEKSNGDIVTKPRVNKPFSEYKESPNHGKRN